MPKHSGSGDQCDSKAPIYDRYATLRSRYGAPEKESMNQSSSVSRHQEKLRIYVSGKKPIWPTLLWRLLVCRFQREPLALGKSIVNDSRHRLHPILAPSGLFVLEQPTQETPTSTVQRMRFLEHPQSTPPLRPVSSPTATNTTPTLKKQTIFRPHPTKENSDWPILHHSRAAHSTFQQPHSYKIFPSADLPQFFSTLNSINHHRCFASFRLLSRSIPLASLSIYLSPAPSSQCRSRSGAYYLRDFPLLLPTRSAAEFFFWSCHPTARRTRTCLNFAADRQADRQTGR